MYQTSTLTLQMFIGCGGINVLVEFLEEDIDTERDLVLIGVNGVWSVFELQGPTPKNDFCRIFSRSSVLYPLSLVLNRVVDEEGKLADLIEGRITVRGLARESKEWGTSFTVDTCTRYEQERALQVEDVPLCGQILPRIWRVDAVFMSFEVKQSQLCCPQRHI